MATYNGAKYIQRQLDSILPYLEDNDELIITDDGSKDGTLDIILSYLPQYPQIRLVDGPRMGVVRNFENGLYHASKDVILFADQDDIWLPEKLPFVRKFFKENNGTQMLLHDMYLASNDEIQNSTYTKRSFVERPRKHGVFNNVFYNGYYGCCMCFTQEFKNSFLPIGEKVNAYDQWIGLLAEYDKTSVFVDSPMIIHRCHDNNVGKNLKMKDKILFRFQLLYSFVYHIKSRRL